jgi:predicted amidohydrolase YtcJ
MEMADAYWGERAAYAYAPKHQFDQGTLVIFGSDAPVESPNPWYGIHAAVTRQRRDGTPGPDGWYPVGRISRTQAIQAFTRNPALSAGKGDIQGNLLPRYWADLIIADRDPFSCHPDDLKEINVIGTMIAGEWVYRDF